MQIQLSRRKFSAILGASFASTVALPQWAFGATDKLETVRVVLGVSAGSMVDNIARQVAELIKPGYAASTFVENKTGAGGIMAVSYLKTLAKDGSNVYVGVSSPLTVYPVTYKKLPYDPDKDLIAVGSLGTFDLALAVGPMVPASVHDLKSYFEWAKKNPNDANFGSPGAGSMPHFVGSMTARSAGIELRHVPYRGPGPAVLDLVGGMVSAVVVPLVDVTEFAAQGKLRILGTTGDARSRFVPNVPTFAEQGFGEYAMGVWIAVFVAAGTPDARVQQLRGVLKQGLAQPEVQAAMGKQLQAAKWGDPEQLQQNIRKERASWKKAVEALNFTPES
ncbi:tripartite tricarboxylate transporter substrate-binding protein [Variovorax sp. J2P1-59]|uniref:tripartite tricarboxylate transporter substrate-binding protein n=1 Tax=Variovorax flavidus TaxID=3053501 RepID=UPI002574F4FF|nr:tripartite tricarboxylate transporter substrate-binding protein [Variovorax sp. J2P1-59]MDM0075849.1 tripartite tricarboxylate transporter substrate-binding protein [Variovorax sp. J2P1-59]